MRDRGSYLKNTPCCGKMYRRNNKREREEDLSEDRHIRSHYHRQDNRRSLDDDDRRGRMRPPEKEQCNFNMQIKQFIKFTQTCSDPHWKPQTERIDDKYWPYVNFIVRLESAADDMEQLLRRVDGPNKNRPDTGGGMEGAGLDGGLWAPYGSAGWGETRAERIFAVNDIKYHSTDADGAEAQQKYFTEDVARLVGERYKGDLELVLPFYNQTTGSQPQHGGWVGPFV